MIDRYTKVVLSVIALALSALAVEQAATPARAQISAGCGTPQYPCYVTSSRPIQVEVIR